MPHMRSTTAPSHSAALALKKALSDSETAVSRAARIGQVARLGRLAICSLSVALLWAVVAACGGHAQASGPDASSATDGPADGQNDPRCPGQWDETTCDQPCSAVGLTCQYPQTSNAMWCGTIGDSGHAVWLCGG